MEPGQQFWTALAEQSGDSAFERTEALLRLTTFRAGESGVALRFPPQSKIGCGISTPECKLENPPTQDAFALARWEPFAKIHSWPERPETICADLHQKLFPVTSVTYCLLSELGNMGLD
jgi:hypothetical protein